MATVGCKESTKTRRTNDHDFHVLPANKNRRVWSFFTHTMFKIKIFPPNETSDEKRSKVKWTLNATGAHICVRGVLVDFTICEKAMVTVNHGAEGVLVAYFPFYASKKCDHLVTVTATPGRPLRAEWRQQRAQLSTATIRIDGPSQTIITVP